MRRNVCVNCPLRVLPDGAAKRETLGNDVNAINISFHIRGTAEDRIMSGDENFVYDSEGNLIEDKSKSLKISYDWRGMPVEFKRQNTCYDVHESIVCDSTKLELAYDGAGRRISKTRWVKKVASVGHDWERELVTHYTGIGTEIRDTYHDGDLDNVKVVVNMPQGLGRYGVEDASDAYAGVSEESRAGYIPTTKFEWYLKNHLGSTMLVYGTQGIASTDAADLGGAKAAYDYRAFGEQVSMMEPAEKVTENFTGIRSARRGQRTNLFVHCRAAGPWRVAQGQDDEIELNYFGARYLDPMLGLWISVDPKRQFASPYLYMGNGYNPIIGYDPDGNDVLIVVSSEKSGGTGRVNMYTGAEVKNGAKQQSENFPLYNIYVSNESGNFAVFEGTRDVLSPGYTSFGSNQLLSGRIREDGPNGFRMEALDPETNLPTVTDVNGNERSNIQIHIRGASHGCTMMSREQMNGFEKAIKSMRDEDVQNGYGDGFDMDFQNFDPDGN